MRTLAILKRNGKWQAVSWQATRMPRPVKEADEVRKEVVAAQTAFHQAMLAADLKPLDGLADESFIWTHRDGEQMTLKQLLDQLGSGQLKYSKLGTNNVTIAIYGDTAIVRGVSPRQRISFPGSGGSGDANPFTDFFTLTFVIKDGDWKAVAMHTSRP